MLVVWELCRTFAEQKDWTMARLIKETPALEGQDLERFIWHMEHPSIATETEKERGRTSYELFKQAADFDW